MYVRSTITGIVSEISVQVGSTVRRGEQVLVVQSMKMEIPVDSPADGTVQTVDVTIGATVNEGDVVAELA
jgi:acetyl-CoA carboxylase biotin carboxyl carrier protein